MKRKWGGKHTVEKLSVVGKYMQAYQTALKKQDFTTFYVDALAGDGVGLQSNDEQFAFDNDEQAEFDELRRGSAILALGVNPLFDFYRFNEKSSRRSAKLTEAVGNFPDRVEAVSISALDVNDFVIAIAAELKPRMNRGIIFLDPFGMQVRWDSVRAIANCRHLDMWYLFPTTAVVRLLTRSGLPIKKWRDRLDLALGDTGWRTEFYKRITKVDLFDGVVDAISRVASFGAVEHYVVRRLMQTFSDGIVLENPLRLGPIGKPLFSLCFACGNPSKKAKELAGRLANEIIETNRFRRL
jgi:three-Cys-motif partner protein